MGNCLTLDNVVVAQVRHEIADFAHLSAQACRNFLDRIHLLRQYLKPILLAVHFAFELG